MKRIFLIISVAVSISLILLASIQQSNAEYEAQAQKYLSEGLYDEAMQVYHHAHLHLGLLKTIVHHFGKFNAFLAILGTLFILTGIFLKKKSSSKRLPLVRVTQDFNWNQTE